MKPFVIKRYLVLLLVFSLSRVSAQIVSTLSSQISNANIEALSIDKFGNLFTPSGQLGIVYKIDKNGTSTTLATGFQWPQGGTTDSLGNFYVSNWSTGVITKIDSSGNKSTFLTGFSGPTGLAFNKTEDELYVCNYSSNVIHKVTVSNLTKTVFASGNGINGPDGIVFDENGNLYIANFNDNKIHKINSSGNINLFATLPGSKSGYLTYAKGFLYSAGLLSHKIYKISLNGTVTNLAGTGTPGFTNGPANQSQFNIPNGIVASHTGDTLFVADAANKAIRVIDLINGTTGIREIQLNLPTGLYLEQNYPNPFNPATKIIYTLSKASIVKIQIYNSEGQVVKVLFSDFVEPGLHRVEWNGENSKGNKVTSGTYFYKVEANGSIQTKKMILMK